jgi:hypothetical protein
MSWEGKRLPAIARRPQQQREPKPRRPLPSREAPPALGAAQKRVSLAAAIAQGAPPRHISAAQSERDAAHRRGAERSPVRRGAPRLRATGAPRLLLPSSVARRAQLGDRRSGLLYAPRPQRLGARTKTAVEVGRRDVSGQTSLMKTAAVKTAVEQL